MGGCFSGLKGLESENAPIPAPPSPKSVEPTTTESVEALKEESPETKEEVTKDADVVPTPTEPEPETTPAPAAEEKAPEAAEDAKVEDVAATASAGSEDKAGAAPTAL